MEDGGGGLHQLIISSNYMVHTKIKQMVDPKGLSFLLWKQHHPCPLAVSGITNQPHSSESYKTKHNSWTRVLLFRRGGGYVLVPSTGSTEIVSYLLE